MHMDDGRHVTGPFQAVVGYRFIQRDRDEAIIELDVEDKHLSQNGVLHGGVTLTLLDTVGGMALVYYRDDIATVVTINISVNFIGTTSRGRIIARAKVDHAGKTVGYVNMSLHEGEANGPMIASAHGSWRLYTKPFVPRG